MIGGDDVVLPAWDVDPDESLAAAVRQVLHEWPKAIIQDGDSGQVFAHFWDVPFRMVRELMVYRDSTAFASWMQDGAEPSNAHSMVHLIADTDRSTVVVDDRLERVTARLIGNIRGLLESSSYRRLEAA